MANKMTRKELREPDAFLKAGGEATSWLEQNRNVVLIGIGAVLLIGAGAAIAGYVSDRANTRAAQALGKTLELLDRPVETGLPNFEAEPSAQPFASQQEKDAAIVKALTDFRAEHPNTPSATTAALTLAQAHYRTGNLDGAIAAYDAYLEFAAKDDPLRAAALEGRGYAYEAKGQLDEAMKSFEELAKLDKVGFLEGMGMYHQARLLIAQGKKEEAAKLLTELRAQLPTSAAANLAQDRLTALASEGVKIPEAPPAATASDGTKG